MNQLTAALAVALLLQACSKAPESSPPAGANMAPIFAQAPAIVTHPA